MSRSDLPVTLTPLVMDDAEFLLRLMQTPRYIEFVGDRGVSNLDEARAYIRDYFFASQKEHGFGYFVVRDEHRTPAGMVGLMKRDYLDFPDIGFAFLPEFFGKGLAKRACDLLLKIAREELMLTELDAFTDYQNVASQKLLLKLGFTYDGDIRHPQENVLLQRYHAQL